MIKFREKKFIKDIVIAGDDGRMYYLEECVWKKHAVPLSEFKHGVKELLKQGVALAAVPEPEDAPTTVSHAEGDPGPLGFCYLVSLASLRTKTIFQEEMEAEEDVSFLAKPGVD